MRQALARTLAVLSFAVVLIDFGPQVVGPELGLRWAVNPAS